LKILHIGDQAGVAALLAFECSKLGHSSYVLQDSSIDTFRIGAYYKNTEYLDNIEQIYRIAFKSAPSHLIYHDQYKMAETFDYMHIPSSYVFHGNMLRGDDKIYDKVLELESIDNIFVTTEDMLDYAPKAELLVRPIDVDLFRPMDIKKQTVPLCLSQLRYFAEIRKRCRDPNGIFLIDRFKHPITYKNMPLMLNSHKTYIDLKFRPTHPPTLIPELSMTGLQAIACGIPVIGWDSEYHETLDRSHYAENSAREFIRVIQE